MHPQGYQRRSLNTPQKGYPELTNLYRLVYMTGPERLVDYLTRKEKNFDQMMSQSISFSRKAFKGKVGCEDLVIGTPGKHNGRTLIPAVSNGLEVIIDAQLQRHI